MSLARELFLQSWLTFHENDPLISRQTCKILSVLSLLSIYRNFKMFVFLDGLASFFESVIYLPSSLTRGTLPHVFVT